MWTGKGDDLNSTTRKALAARIKLNPPTGAMAYPGEGVQFVAKGGEPWGWMTVETFERLDVATLDFEAGTSRQEATK